MMIKDWIKAAVTAWHGKDTSQPILENKLEIDDEEKPVKEWVQQSDGSIIPAKDDPRYAGSLTQDGRVISSTRLIPFDRYPAQIINAEIQPPKKISQKEAEKLREIIDSLKLRVQL